MPSPSSELVKRDRRREPTGVNVRQISIFHGIARLADPGAAVPVGAFWPSLSPKNLANWQIGDPESIAMSEKGVRSRSRSERESPAYSRRTLPNLHAGAHAVC